MKVLLVETQITGHHEKYLKGLLGAIKQEDDYLIVLPEAMNDSTIDTEKTKIIPFEKNGRTRYFSWLVQLRKVIKGFEPDLIHLTYGDDLYRFFGAGLHFISGKISLGITYHQVRRSKLRDLSYRCIAQKCCWVVVHTQYLSNDLKLLGINNIAHIEYPQFNETQIIMQHEALKKLEITNAVGKVMLALGGTREDKGLDTLLKALQEVNDPFHLIIAGKEEYYKRPEIEELIKNYREKVTLFLGFLSDEKVGMCLNASDVIVLPYRKAFDGASGPMGEGVWLKKQIVGPNHGSLGEIISTNHLGEIFDSEDSCSLADVISHVLQEEWIPDEQYDEYRQSLDPISFAGKYRELYLGGEK